MNAAAVLRVTLDDLPCPSTDKPHRRRRQWRQERPRRPSSPHRALKNHWDHVDDIGARFGQRILRTLLSGPNETWSNKLLARRARVSEACASKFVAECKRRGLVSVEKCKTRRRNARMNVITVNPTCPPLRGPKPRRPRATRKPQHFRGSFSEENKGEALQASPDLSNPKPSSRTPSRAREAEPEARPVQKNEGIAPKPAVAGSTDRIVAFQQHQRWARKNREDAIKKQRWCRRVFHWAQKALARGVADVTAADVALLDRALWLTGHGNYYDLHPDERDRIDELSHAEKAIPIEYPLPTTRSLPPIGVVAGGPTLIPAQPRGWRPRAELRAELLAGWNRSVS